MRRPRSVKLLAIPVWIILAAGAGFVMAQGTYNHAAFDKEMEDAGRRIRVVLGGLIAEDWSKAEKEAAALSTQAVRIRGLTPKVESGKIAIFHATADSMGARANRLASSARAKDGAAAARALGEVVESCVSCHAIFRK